MPSVPGENIAIENRFLESEDEEQADGAAVEYVTPLAELSLQMQLPSMYTAKEFVEGGGLMSYGPVSPPSRATACTRIGARAARPWWAAGQRGPGPMLMRIGLLVIW